MDIELTEEQIEAIEHEYTSPAIVTAAAGSGKTTLLVERVIRLISDCENRIPADTLAIMTFTVNATTQLREKLQSALDEKIKALHISQGNENQINYLSEQKIALRSATISTISSFCLGIIRENVESFGLPINFTIANKPKTVAMQQASVDAALERFYSEDDDALCSKDERDTLFCTFGFGDDNDLKDKIISVANSLSSYSDADEWMNNAVHIYDSIDTLWDNYREIFKDYVTNFLNILKGKTDVYDTILANYENDISQAEKNIESMQEAYNEMNNYIDEDKQRFENIESSCRDFINNPSIDNFYTVVQTVSNNQNNKNQVGRKGSNETKKLFTKVKNSFQNNIESFIENTEFDIDEEKRTLPAQRTAVVAFTKLLAEYIRIYSDTKKQQGAIDFSDCELLLLDKLKEDEDLRKSLESRFSCIIVDEFQDTNDVQAEIFNLIGKNHLFYVGDVKQAIYAFRGGNPDIMAGLMENNSGFKVIPLNNNFRSRQPIINTVNAAFSGLMTKELGGVDYDNGNELILGAKYPDVEDKYKDLYKSDIYFINKPGSKKAKKSDEKKSDETAQIDKNLVQVNFIGQKILELKDNENFLITKDKRPARFSDFAILLRSNKEIPTYKAALADMGIPAVISTGKDLFAAEEVCLLVNLLKVIDNPYNNEAMLNVLMSPLYNFNAEDMAKIKLGILGCNDIPVSDAVKPITDYLRSQKLYKCMLFCNAPFTEPDENTSDAHRVRYQLHCDGNYQNDEKLANFMNSLKKFRKYMSSYSLSDLIQKVMDDTDIIPIFYAVDGSKQRASNLKQIKEMAEDYESREGSSLSGFLRYLNAVGKGDVEEVSAPDDLSDAVRIMTFHASKGLEVPVCFLAELDNSVNREYKKNPLMISHDKYLAMRYVDRFKRYTTTPLALKALRIQYCRKMVGEELRLLYVAMTRAKEKLIMVGNFDSDSEQVLTNITVFPYEIETITTPFKWVLASLFHGGYTDDCVISNTEPCQVVKAQEKSEEISVDLSEVQKLVKLMQPIYPNSAETTQLSKQSVTELVHKTSPSMVNLPSPSFDAEKISGFEVGNAYHHAMEHFPLDKIRYAKSDADAVDIVANALDMLSDKGLITERERGFVKEEKIVEFFRSEPGKRMLASNRVEREFAFTYPSDGEELGTEKTGGSIIKGQIDMFFTENDGIVIVDYKSDSKKSLDEEMESYRKQVQIYSKILPKFTGLPIKQIYIYSFSEGKEFEICQN